MKKGFNEEEFINYLQGEITNINYFTREIILNIIEYAHEHEHTSKDQFCNFISKMLSKVEFGEVAMFMEDKCLTEHGQARKKEYLKKIWREV